MSVCDNCNYPAPGAAAMCRDGSALRKRAAIRRARKLAKKSA